MREDAKMNGKPWDPMRQDEKTYGKPSNSNEKDQKTFGKPSEGRWGNHVETIKVLWGKIRKWMVNHQIPIRKDKNTYGKPK